MAWDGLKLESCVSVLSPCAQSMAGFRLLAAWSALGLTQTCSLCSLHTLSARWFVCTRRIWAQSVCFEKKKWFMQPVKMPRCSLAQPAVCLSVTHCSLHMQWLRCSSICFSLWLCVYMTMYVSCLLLLQRNTTPVFRRSFLSSSARQQLAWSSLSPWSSSLLFATGESVLSQSRLHTVQVIHTGCHKRHFERLNLAQKSFHRLNVCFGVLFDVR